MKFEYSETQHLEDFDRVIRSHLKKGYPVRLNKPSERAVKKADRDPRIIAWRSSCAKYECISTEIKSSATENFDCERLRSAARNIALRAQDMAHYATPMMPDWTERDVTALRQVLNMEEDGDVASPDNSLGTARETVAQEGSTSERSIVSTVIAKLSSLLFARGSSKDRSA